MSSLAWGLPTYSGWHPPGASVCAIEGASTLFCLFVFPRHQKNNAPSSSKAATPPAAGPATHALDVEGFGSSVAVGGGSGGLLVDVVTAEVTVGSEVAGDEVVEVLLVEVVEASISRYMVYAFHAAAQPISAQLWLGEG